MDFKLAKIVKYSKQTRSCIWLLHYYSEWHVLGLSKKENKICCKSPSSVDNRDTFSRSWETEDKKLYSCSLNTLLKS